MCPRQGWWPQLGTHMLVYECVFVLLRERMEQVTKHCWKTQEVVPRPPPSGRCVLTSKPPLYGDADHGLETPWVCACVCWVRGWRVAGKRMKIVLEMGVQSLRMKMSSCRLTSYETSSIFRTHNFLYVFKLFFFFWLHWVYLAAFGSYSLVLMPRLLMVVASLGGEHGL